MARILVAGDEQDLCELFATWLTREGHTVEAATDWSQHAGARALDAFDLIVLDYAQLNENALRAARTLREDEGHRDAPILLITSRPVPSQLASMRAAGVSAHLDKPCTLRDLSAVVGHLVS